MTSIFTGVLEYVQLMIERVSGDKILICDAETIGIVGMVLTMNKILKQEVFRVARIDMEETEEMGHMNAILFLRPIDANYLLLAQKLKKPSYHEYHIFFSNAVPRHRLERLACCDEHEVVHQIEEFYADVYAINHDLFSLNLPSTIRLSEEHNRWTEYEQKTFDRIVEGLLSACLCLQMLPAIRYNSTSPIATQVAWKLQSKISAEQSLSEAMKKPKKGSPSPVVLILDRRNDPVTPLLNQWTYQAMVHEVFTIENNRVDLSKIPGVQPELMDVVMSTTHEDQFFEEHCLSTFPTVMDAVNEAVHKQAEDYKRQQDLDSKLETAQAIASIIHQYPQLKQQQGNLSKHRQIIAHLKKHTEDTGLQESCQLEQEIACTENKDVQYRELIEEIKGSKITNMQRLRLVLLYALRYEDRKTIATLKKELQNKGISPEQVRLVDQLLAYSGSHVRSGDLFGNKTALAQVNSMWQSALRGNLFQGPAIISVLTQHRTSFGTVADALMKGQLDVSSYPFVESMGLASTSRDPPPKAIVFIIGGASYEEARDVSALNKSLSGGRCVVFGGTTMHNSRTFLAEVAQHGVED